MDKKYFIIDFDSTFIKSESLDDLAKICLERNHKKLEIVKKIGEITRLGMEGKIDFGESLRRRMDLLIVTKDDLKKLANILKNKVTISIKRNKGFFKKYCKQIYIISGGFKEYIWPIVKKYYLDEDHVFANSFIFDSKGRAIGYDQKNPLCKNGGKAKVVRSLNLKGKIHVIGDGYTDYELKEIGLAQSFTAFIENVKRESVLKRADKIAPNFDEFLFENKLPTSLSYPKNRIKVLLLENIDTEAVKRFEGEGFLVEHYQSTLPTNKLKEKLKDVSILGIRSRTILTKEVLNHADRLMTVGAFCIGTDQIDLKTASKKGIAVFNAPYSNSRSVVELIIGEIIMLMRNIFQKNNQLHQGTWEKSSVGSYEIRGKTLGIVGYGNIGSQLSVLAESLGMKVVFFDIVDKLALGNAKKCKNLEEVLRNSDVISIHVDGNPNNINLISEKEFRLMKPGAIFLNASRGKIVDIKALTTFLKLGKIKGAAIDVFPKEPKNKGEKFSNELQNMENVILTPHIGGSTEEAQKNIGFFLSEKIINYINNGDTSINVNFPNIKVDPVKKFHRLLHVHKNIPGILAKINGVIAKNKLNIENQYLKTHEDIGYVITDINKKYNHGVLKELRKIPDTIRFRVLY